ncbi:ribosome biogenesis GTPase YlqF [Bacteriovorax sp. Seq25_V]|uniref:ribosome biogenesis GTPase YlqF n=1 Tax=Bacteriovorax sp. Seq25_V TaxID=1201288 RepID=UPI000389DBC2|nr:ribosome biogenesis GTPase YlqF [Bacteriovorax sp. Seq25_V]EQC47216.1 ribosome biogenesis GTP-binding protein YlqF [Bacteriovorax sp. Seq25_V]
MAKRSNHRSKVKPKRNDEDDNEYQLTDDTIALKKIHWFPGHMKKALDKIKTTLKMVDIILEVRDARSPLVTGNRDIDEIVGNKNRLIVMNKTNLANPQIVKLWEQWFEKQGKPFIFINGLDKKSLARVVELSKAIVMEKRDQSNPEAKAKKKFKMMVLGLPNTGKSTIINKLANRDASKVANKPGQTQNQLWVNVNEDLEILDNPGVMPHRIVKEEHGLWLSALHAIPDTVVDLERPVIYILEYLIKEDPQILKSHYNIEFDSNYFLDVLNLIAKSRGCLRQKGEFDYERVYRLILADFRDGNLGLISFGLPPQ